EIGMGRPRLWLQQQHGYAIHGKGVLCTHRWAAGDGGLMILSRGDPIDKSRRQVRELGILPAHDEFGVAIVERRGKAMILCAGNASAARVAIGGYAGGLKQNRESSFDLLGREHGDSVREIG